VAANSSGERSFSRSNLIAQLSVVGYSGRQSCFRIETQVAAFEFDNPIFAAQAPIRQVGLLCIVIRIVPRMCSLFVRR
jgi:hypothetical protein